MTTALRSHRGRPFCNLVGLLITPLLLICCGCPVAPPAPAASGGGGGTGTSGGGNTTPNTSGGLPIVEPGTNTSISSAAALDLSTGEIRFVSTIRSGRDINVFQLGSLAAGDRIVADIQAQNDNLDAVAAVFDADARLVDFNDDRDPNDLNPLIDFVLRANPGAYFLAIIGFPGSGTTGEYEADVRIQRQVGVPAPHNQIVFLDWRGGSGIAIPNVGTFDLSPFSATDVGFPNSQTQALKDATLQVAQDRYHGFDIAFLSSDHEAVPAAAHSTVYFGGDVPQAFAVSQDIDSYNQNPSDDSIVFVNDFANSFSHPPSFNEMATALGNTVAHEVGHLLGLVHTADCLDLMDTSCANDRLLVPQELSTAPLDASVFPFGVQPEPDLLTWILGLIGV
jgi:hypothetical protein